MDADLVIRAILKACVLPPVSSVVLIGGGLWALRSQRRWGWVLTATGLITLLALSLPIVADALAMRVAGALPYPDVDSEPEQAIVVLSGGIRVNARSESGEGLRGATLARLAAAAGLARRTGLPLLVSGGMVEKGPPEARVMADVLQADFGLQAAFVEDRSRNTHENAIESARILRAAGIRRVWLVTSDVHLPRAEAEFQRTGLQVRPFAAGGPGHLPGGVWAWLLHPWALEESHAALYEWLGRAVMRGPHHD